MTGINIRKLRNNMGLTQTELGNKLGVIKQTISNWENNISSPSNEMLTSMSILFNVSVDYLLGIDSDKQHKAEDNNSSKISPEDELLLASMTTKAKNLIDTFLQLDEDNQDIILGEAKKALRDQKYINNVSKRKDIAT